jgi:hypothetical protein
VPGPVPQPLQAQADQGTAAVTPGATVLCPRVREGGLPAQSAPATEKR